MEAQSLKDVKTIHDGSLAKSFLSNVFFPIKKAQTEPEMYSWQEAWRREF